MHQIHTFAGEQGAQCTHMPQAQQRLAADVECDVFGAQRLQLRHQAAAGGDDNGAMAGADQRVGDLQRGALDAAGFQRGQELNDGQAAHAAAPHAWHCTAQSGLGNKSQLLTAIGRGRGTNFSAASPSSWALSLRG